MDGLNRMIGVSSSSAASFHMDHMMQDLSGPCRVSVCLCPPTYAHSLLDPRWPEGSSPQAGVVPAGTAESLAKEGGREGGDFVRPGEHCQQPPNLPHHPPTLCPYLPSPTYRQTLLLNVCICVCALVIYLHIGVLL